MNFNPAMPDTLFSLKISGKKFSDFEAEKSTVSVSPDRFERVYLLPNGLKITQTVDLFRGGKAAYWVNYFENTGNSDTPLLSDIYDCDLNFPFDYDPPTRPGYIADETALKVVKTAGSNINREEWLPTDDHIFPGQSFSYQSIGGRSSQGLAPFFEVNRQDKGVLLAIGWTGQWKAVFSRSDSEITIQTGLEGAAFKLHPGERIRTTSVLMMTYDNGSDNAHNEFKRILKDHFSIIGAPGRPENGPLCASAWGSLHSDKMIDRIEGITKHDLGFEYYWVDAGWYGNSTTECPDEFTGDWGGYTGDWRVNRQYHPDDLQEVAQKIKESGLKFILWFEPERCIYNTPLPTEHPDWFLHSKNDSFNVLLDLGNEEALQATIDMVSDYIEKLDIACYRQDFNFDPLCYWQENDEPERSGLKEIKHIMGLYRFWDALLARFPHLMIDNCASGGKRIDIETNRRSMPLWRSDHQCCWDREAESAQCHGAGISRWIPYSGTGVGIVMGDTYRMRSSYGASLTTACWSYDKLAFSTEQPLDLMRRQNKEYKRVRPYMSCDFYPLVPLSVDDTCWGGWQYNRPEKSDGIILAFRRPKSPFDEVTVFPQGLADEKTYEFEDADTGEVFSVSAEELGRGFQIRIKERKQSKLFFYKAK